MLRYYRVGGELEVQHAGEHLGAVRRRPLLGWLEGQRRFLDERVQSAGQLDVPGGVGRKHGLQLIDEHLGGLAAIGHACSRSRSPYSQRSLHWKWSYQWWARMRTGGSPWTTSHTQHCCPQRQ